MLADTASDIFRSAKRAWIDAFRAAVAMPWVTGIAFALLIALGFVSDMVPPLLHSGDETLGQSVMWSAAAGVAESFLLTPLLIAIHRHVLLGEVTHRYAFDFSDQRFLQFFYFSFALSLLQALSFFAAIHLFPDAFSGPASGIDKNGGGVAIVAAIMIGVLVIAARVILVFPAAAVDAPGATWGNALKASSGRFWLIASIFILIGMPPLILWLFAGSAFDIGERNGLAQTFFMLQELPASCAYAAGASRLYEAFGKPLSDPAAGGNAHS
jgi:hypothetical protein